MSESSILTVLLSLSSGETFEDIPVTDLEVTLGEFLDVSLKALEVSNFLLLILGLYLGHVL